MAGTQQDAQVRNIALAGPAGAGKTALLERLLLTAGAIREGSEAARGGSVSDWTPQEKSLGHSTETAVCHLEQDGVRIHLIDTPGMPELLGRTLSVLPAVETLALVLSARSGVDAISRRLMDEGEKRRLCRLLVVNRIDESPAALEALFHEIRAAFGKRCLPINLPADGGSRVTDCFFGVDGRPPDFWTLEAAHTAIVDQVVELDEALMQLYLEEGVSPDVGRLHDSFEAALRAGHLVPLCFVSAATGAGVRQLLNVMKQLMPAPAEGNPPEFLAGGAGKARPVKVAPDPAAHFVAHVFKVTIDPYLGRMGIFRVHQGTVRTGDAVFVGERRKAIRVAHLHRLQGRDTVEIPCAGPGDIAGLSRVDEIGVGSVLHASHDEDAWHLRPVPLPQPVFGLAVAPSRRGEEKKLSEALHRFAAEDPSLVIHHDPHLNETVLRGLGERHVRLVLQRMQDEMGLDIDVRTPRIAYRETVQRAATGHCRHKKQTGGAGQFGEVFLRIEPMPRGAGIEFASEVVGGAIPAQFIPAVEKGVRQALAEGAVAGYPLDDLRVVVYDGKHHAVDSKEIAFVTAGRKAVLDAVPKAEPILLEPVARLSITVPEDCVGDITGDLTAHRGRISESTTGTDHQVVIRAELPEAELLDYAARLRGLTAGRGAFEAGFDHYAPVPPDVQRRLAEGFSPRAEA